MSVKLNLEKINDIAVRPYMGIPFISHVSNLVFTKKIKCQNELYQQHNNAIEEN